MMKFSNSKSLVFALTGIGLLSITAIANAAPIHINNESSTDLSFTVEHVCSSEFGNINAKSSKTISQIDLQNACNPHTDVTEHCHVKVYSKPNCKGTHIESIELSTRDGIFLLEGGHPDPQGKDLAFIASQFDLAIIDPAKK